MLAFAAAVLALVLAVRPVAAYQTERVVLVIIDGLRYTEGMGDPARTYVPEMGVLAQQGTLVETFLNDGYTYTARAVPAIWCGGWTQMVSFSDPDCGGTSNYYSSMPSLFEYYRKGLSRPASDCIYVLKYLCSWKGSFNPSYGPTYWPTYHAAGSTDDDVWAQAQTVLATQAPHFMLLYLADVDHAGHSGVWNDYTQAIANADDIVGRLWQTLQTNPVYAGKTTMIVTNDHGRHTTDFTGHGDSCAGCRRIQLLAIGPDIRIRRRLHRAARDSRYRADHRGADGVRDSPRHRIEHERDLPDRYRRGEETVGIGPRATSGPQPDDPKSGSELHPLRAGTGAVCGPRSHRTSGSRDHGREPSCGSAGRDLGRSGRRRRPRGRGALLRHRADTRR